VAETAEDVDGSIAAAGVAAEIADADDSSGVAAVAAVTIADTTAGTHRNAGLN